MKFENLILAGIVSVDIKVLWQVTAFIMKDRGQSFDDNYCQYL
jgi:hypothetical protein